jgi:hypothetical protein
MARKYGGFPYLVSMPQTEWNLSAANDDSRVTFPSCFGLAVC